jgi:hypothetical protein
VIFSVGESRGEKLRVERKEGREKLRVERKEGREKVS